MATLSAACSSNKQVIIPLRDHSHEVCVAATEKVYWEQVDMTRSCIKVNQFIVKS